jgi:hypothetical protein
MSLSLDEAIAAVRAGRLLAVLDFKVTATSCFDDEVWDFDAEAIHGIGFEDQSRICFSDLFCGRRSGSAMSLEVSTRALMFLLKSEGRSWPTVWRFAQTLRLAHQVMLERGIQRWSDVQPLDYTAIERALRAIGEEEVERVRLLVILAQVYAQESPLIDAPRFTIEMAAQMAVPDLR